MDRADTGERSGAQAEPRRQERGRRRMKQILRAGAQVFSEAGYEKATTNAIAARAGISPGSLYQFFKSKEAIARALADLYVSQLREAKSDAFDAIGQLPVRDAVDRVIDPLVAFNIANPGFKALFARTDMPDELQAAVAPIHESIRQQVAAAISALIPSLKGDELDRTVTMAIHIVRGTMPPIVAADGPTRDALIDELKTVLVSYLTWRGAR